MINTPFMPKKKKNKKMATTETSRPRKEKRMTMTTKETTGTESTKPMHRHTMRGRTIYSPVGYSLGRVLSTISETGTSITAADITAGRCGGRGQNSHYDRSNNYSYVN